MFESRKQNSGVDSLGQVPSTWSEWNTGNVTNMGVMFTGSRGSRDILILSTFTCSDSE